MKSGDSKRIFLALDLAQAFSEEAKHILSIAKVHYPQVDWIRPENFHITLHFFGDTTSEEIESIEILLQNVARSCAPFEISLKGVGFFPNKLKPRVVWAGLQGDLDELNQIQSKIEKSLKAQGYACEDRPYVPHVTLARIRNPIYFDDVVFEKMSSLIGSSPKSVDGLTLFESILSPSGVRYLTLQRFSFSGTFQG